MERVTVYWPQPVKSIVTLTMWPFLVTVSMSCPDVNRGATLQAGS
jgi:hypothetical protein